MSQTVEEAHERAYSFLKLKIARCDYRPLDRLYANQIADEIQTSRTPVREALGRLVQEGLVRKDRGWGYVVSEFSSQDIRDLYSVRQALEVEAAREAIGRMTPAEFARIEKLLDTAARHLQRSRIADFVRTSRELHLSISRCSGNGLLINMLDGIHDRIQVLGLLLNMRNASRSREVLKENAAIVRALGQRDFAALEVAIRTHLANGCALTIEARRDSMAP
jgi:DNA-binding GntR family transcriptional regulator